MIDPGLFFNELNQRGVDFFTGVPDSLLKEFCAYVEDNASQNIITANEGNAVALAAGRYLATKKPALVYMQNSGIGNAVNPLLSLVDKEVYKIPALIMIGWRGEPGVADEPQHIKQGKVTLKLIDTMEIDYEILDENSDVKSILDSAFDVLERNLPFVIIVKKGSFSNYKLKNSSEIEAELGKEAALEQIIQNFTSDDLIVSTTGKLSRELFEIRERNNQTHSNDFLTVGSMGHTSQIALGIALSKPKKTVYCLDGDGSFLMHMGSIAVNANLRQKNLKHIVFNNGAHDSVGGQPTVAANLDLSEIAKSCGFSNTKRVRNKAELDQAITEMKQGKLDFLEIMVKKGARSDLGRPTISPEQCKISFMEQM